MFSVLVHIQTTALKEMHVGFLFLLIYLKMSVLQVEFDLIRDLKLAPPSKPNCFHSAAS